MGQHEEEGEGEEGKYLQVRWPVNGRVIGEADEECQCQCQPESFDTFWLLLYTYTKCLGSWAELIRVNAFSMTIRHFRQAQTFRPSFFLPPFSLFFFFTNRFLILLYEYKEWDRQTEQNRTSWNPFIGAFRIGHCPMVFSELLTTPWGPFHKRPQCI